MNGTVRKHWPLFASIVILWLTLAAVLVLSINQNQGHFVYDVDDAYIHMATAKNWVQHGVWGVTRYEFTSATSSIVWPLLLAAIYFLFGVNDASPLLLNVIFASLAIGAVYAILSRYRPAFPQPYIFLVLVAVTFLTPLPAVIFTGLEHVLHALVTIVFAYLSAEELSRESQPPASNSRLLWALAAAITMIRWEGLFLVFVVCVLLLLRRRWLYSFALGAIALVPVVAYGAVSVANGWYLLPNSLLLNGKTPSFDTLEGIIGFLGYSLYKDFLAIPYLLLLTLLAVCLYVIRSISRKGIWEHGQIMLTLFIVTTLLHVQFAGRIRWFHRHDAYLVAFGLFVIAVTLFECLPRRMPKIKLTWELVPRYIAIAILVLFLIGPYVKRGAVTLAQRGMSTLEVAQATTNIYEQHYQMALFLRRFYTGETVAANDIGAINYLADIRCLDLVGLASLDVARERRADNFDREQLAALARARDAKVAIVYESWFSSILPSQWTKIGQWTIANNVVAGNDTVSFYAVDPSDEGRLVSSLVEFASSLPKTVKQSGKYTAFLMRSESSLPAASADPVPKDVLRLVPHE